MKQWREQILLEKVCPKCGKHLEARDGKYGEFLGCSGFPTCHYSERGADIEHIYQPPSPYCEKCNHTGLLPFKNREGKVIPHAFLHCECKRDGQDEHYSHIKPENFDYPMSYSWRAYYAETMEGIYLPALEPPLELLNTQPLPVPTAWTRDQWDSIQQLRAMMLHLQKKITELQADKQKREGNY